MKSGEERKVTTKKTQVILHFPYISLREPTYCMWNGQKLPQTIPVIAQSERLLAKMEWKYIYVTHFTQGVILTKSLWERT